MDTAPEQPSEQRGPGAEGTARHARPEAWADLAERMARFEGLVGEVADPLAWGMDLVEESLAGPDESEQADTERFYRSYETFAGEPFGVETLREAAEAEERDEVLRAALSTAIAAPLHGDLRTSPGVTTSDGDPAPAEDFADAYQDYRSAMRAVFDDVGRAVIETSPRRDGGIGPAARVSARGITAQYVEVAQRALLVTGPTDLVERVQVVMRPVHNLLHGDEGPRF
ncbi:hypothetical protein CLV28_0672 [Sediminihabitans luteus]|uniref:Uncharacterized protein n=1 Tax=Sediminihabitans luteus TaxID=1138585 RepID=A0A2M9D024_9CELL|nr:hypothetical protein [Sediminihabitans luteus]PJJ77453.1 hypothetical protein CLV28_0672 [Sediminihabitans luteus]GII98346.1 hypothetical protein Slu03_07240 [Sediminihabitans luteus]